MNINLNPEQLDRIMADVARIAQFELIQCVLLLCVFGAIVVFGRPGGR
jgi:hypothetical protein